MQSQMTGARGGSGAGETSARQGRELDSFREWIYRTAGISMSERKRTLIAGRLSKRMRELGLTSYAEYFAAIMGGEDPAECQRAIDLLTTNETRFFRERAHFDMIAQRFSNAGMAGRSLRVWSAACSTGEEPYTLAMTLAEAGLQNWEILGSDISTRVLEIARRGIYPLSRIDGIPSEYLRKYCLRGVGSRDGTFAVDPELMRKVHFRQVNLNEKLPDIGEFDIVFLRNVMIYFDSATKKAVVDRVAGVLRPGGLLVIGHAESLHGVGACVRHLAPSLFERAGP